MITLNKKVLNGVLTEVNLKKVLPLIPILEEKKEIRPKEAEDILGKSTSTTYRYLNILVDAGILVSEGNTNNIVLDRQIPGMNNIRPSYAPSVLRNKFFK